jgi:hypothetical protein
MTLFVQHTKAQAMADNERAVPLISLLGAARGLVLSLLFTSIIYITTH